MKVSRECGEITRRGRFGWVARAARCEQVMHLVAFGDGQLYAKAVQIIDRWKQRATH
jgi:hypothetical protein